MTQQAKHTAGRLALGPVIEMDGGTGLVCGTRIVQAPYDAESQDIAYVHPSADADDIRTCEERDSNAARIVRSWNCFDQLLEACNAFLDARPQCDCPDHSGCTMADARKLARAAIAATEEGQP